MSNEEMVNTTGDQVENAPRSEPPVEKQLDKELHDLIGPFLQERGIKNAILIAMDSKSDKLALYYRGHFYDVTRMLAEVYRKFKLQIDEEVG